MVFQNAEYLITNPTNFIFFLSLVTKGKDMLGGIFAFQKISCDTGFDNGDVVELIPIR